MKPAAQRVFDLLCGLRNKGKINESELDELLDATGKAEVEFCNTVLERLNGKTNKGGRRDVRTNKIEA